MIKNKALRNLTAVFILIALNISLPFNMSDYRSAYTTSDITEYIVLKNIGSKKTAALNSEDGAGKISEFILKQYFPKISGSAKNKSSDLGSVYSAAGSFIGGASNYKKTAVNQSGNYHNGNPLVVIYHTHTTESYLDGPSNGVYRSDDPNKNVLSVGHIISSILYNNYGIETLLLTDIYDKPYDTAYDKSYEAVYGALEKYPSIRYAFDIHRDGLDDRPENYAIYSTEFGGLPTSKVMMVMGTKADKAYENIAFAYKIRDKMLEACPQLYKDTLERPYRYNQSIADISVLFEVGSNLSTLQEAQNTAEALAAIIGEIIQNNY